MKVVDNLMYRFFHNVSRGLSGGCSDEVTRIRAILCPQTSQIRFIFGWSNVAFHVGFYDV